MRIVNVTPEILVERYLQVRSATINICEPLETEDFVVQPIQEVSPPKWHLGHTTWFFDRMMLRPFLKGYESDFLHYDLLFNSYYKSCGEHWLQKERGQLSRPTTGAILDYRAVIDQKMVELLKHYKANLSPDKINELVHVLEIGLHHEQQHQELLLMDIKYILGVNPYPNPYTNKPLDKVSKSDSSFFQVENADVYEIGAFSKGFRYDNESPRHKNYLYPFSISNSLVTNGQYLEFMEDKGYETPRLWLSKGWDWVNSNRIRNPLYWKRTQKDKFQEFSLHGLAPLDLNAPVSHISYFEASAYAKWAGGRLPTEQEYEVYLQSQKAAESHDCHTAFATGFFHPTQPNASSGQLWCWTQSHYSPYPGFREFDQGLGEYNGKFMCNQFVLKGGCFATPLKHYRDSYRNFYEPHQRWMFSGIRIAKDLL